MVRRINLDYSTMQFSSDDNYFYMQKKTSNNITYFSDEASEFFIMDRIVSNQKLLARFFLRSSPSCTIIERTYQKANTFLANFGGLISNILLILIIFVQFFNEFWANQEVLNNIIKFSDHMKTKYPDHLNLLQNNLKRFKSDFGIKVSEDNQTPNNSFKLDESKEKNSHESKNIPPIIDFNLSPESKDNLLKNAKNNIELNEIPLSKEELSKKILDNSIDFIAISNDYKHNLPNFMNSKNLFVSNNIPVEIENKIENFENIEQKDNNQIIQDHNKIEKFEKNEEKYNNQIIQDHNKIDNTKLRLKRSNTLVFDKELEGVFNESKEALNFSCYEILLRYFLCKSKNLTIKTILYEKAKNKLVNYFDVVSYIKKMQEIEILKY